MKMTSSAVPLSVFVLAVLMSLCTTMAVPPEDKISKSSFVTRLEEAQHIALDASEELLPKSKLVTKIMSEVAIIRAQQPAVAKVRNDGRWKLGEVEIVNITLKNMDDIKQSEYGPVKEVIQVQRGLTTVVFDKPYNPDLLAAKIHSKFGVVVRGVWKEKQADFGSISYSIEDNTYTFRQGLENCAPSCTENHFWVYKIDKNNKFTLDYEFATDIPEQHFAD